MIKSLTSLRGIFILFIFFHHCLSLYPGGGTMAVSFFFILGGFSMTLGYKDKVKQPDFSYRHYIIRRCIKFYPLHWMCLSVAVLLSIATMRFGIKELPSLFLNSILLQTWIPEERIYFSFNAVSWYLADTMFFAVMFPFLFKWIMMASKKGRLIIASVITVLYAIVAISLPVEKFHAILYIGPYMRLTDFMFGIYLALLYLKLKERPVKWLKINHLGEMFILSVIVMLVVESCVLPKTVSFIAPVYWVGVALLIIIAAMTERTGGGARLYIGEQIPATSW